MTKPQNLRSKLLNRFTLGLALGLGCLTALAASTVPNTFNAGEAISASKINANFTSLATGKQDTITETCVAGTAIRSVATDGTVTCDGTSSNTANSLVARDASGGVNATSLSLSGGSLLASGTTGTTPASGEGTRLMWIPSKGAFRAGRVAGSEWDDANVGTNSFAGGRITTASGEYSTAFGLTVTNSGFAGFAAGNDITCTASYCAVIGGDNNVTASGGVALGRFVSSTGTTSVVLGLQAQSCLGTPMTGARDTCDGTSHKGVFLFGDGSGTFATNLKSIADNEFAVRASGGYRLFSNANMTTGVTMAAGSGTWSTLSDRNVKTRVRAVDASAVLNKVVRLPISTWQYKAQDASVRHMGPMAQDFRAVFGLGVSDKTIDTVDPDGVALAAIQGLNTKLESELEAKQKIIDAQATKITAQQKINDAQAEKIDALTQANEDILARLARLEAE